jgi:lambda repressor-like predicted transcriptional regulator
MIRQVILLLGASATLSACGNRAGLEPRQGQNLPVAPYGREEPLAADALLVPPVQAAPERNVELRRRSEERANDAFDLPPKE